MTIEELPDPDDTFARSDHGSDHSNDDEELVGGPDRDPQFVEREDAALGAHPEDEPLMDDDMLHAFLEMNLGDYAKDEWFELCECHIPIIVI